MKRPLKLHSFRSHSKRCALRGRANANCDCPIWIDGIDEHGQRVCFSLGTNNAAVAERMKRAAEMRGAIEETEVEAEAAAPIVLGEACRRFVEANAELSPDRIKKYERLFRRMVDFGQRRGLRYLRDLDLDVLTAFRVEWYARWHQQPGTMCLNIQILRKFFRFGVNHKWTKVNPAAELEMPKARQRPTLPFVDEEWQRILGAFGKYEKRAGHVAARRLYAFVLLMRYSGMRIGDCVRSEKSWIVGDRVSFCTQKTNAQVRNKLPTRVVELLNTLPLNGGRFFFWTGASTLHSAVGKWQRRLRVLFDLAGIPKGHSHRFRDTYAFDLTHHGETTLEELRQALGHANTRVTEKFYSHWIAERQKRLEEKQDRAWTLASARYSQDGLEARYI
jgi:integrase